MELLGTFQLAPLPAYWPGAVDEQALLQLVEWAENPVVIVAAGQQKNARMHKLGLDTDHHFQSVNPNSRQIA